MTLSIREIHFKTFITPLNKPFRTALGEHRALNNILIRTVLSDGTEGLGEVAVAPHILGWELKKIESLLKEYLPSFQNRALILNPGAIKCMTEPLRVYAPAVCGVETALLDALCRRARMPFWQFFGSHCRRIRTGITLVIQPRRAFLQSLEEFYTEGFRTFKIKVGRDTEADLGKILAARRILEKSIFYIDANQGFNVRQSSAFISALMEKGMRPAFIEQPVERADLDGLAELRRSLPIPVCADESVHSLESAKKIIRMKGAQIFNIKLAKFGIFQAMEITQLAKKNGLTLMIGMMMESALGVSAAAQFAAGTSGFKYIDLDTPYYFKNTDGLSFLGTSGNFRLSSIRRGLGGAAVSGT